MKLPRSILLAFPFLVLAAACGGQAQGTSSDAGRVDGGGSGGEGGGSGDGPSPCEQQGGTCLITDLGMSCPSGTVSDPVVECYVEPAHTCCLPTDAGADTGADVVCECSGDVVMTGAGMMVVPDSGIGPCGQPSCEDDCGHEWMAVCDSFGAWSCQGGFPPPPSCLDGGQD